jgi:hypothetical protein
MTEAEQAAALAAIIKSGGRSSEPPPPSDDQPKLAKDMSEDERQNFLKEHIRRFS